MAVSHAPLPTDLRRFMIFVDGENFAKGGPQLSPAPSLVEGPYYKRDVFLWFKDKGAFSGLLPALPAQVRAERFAFRAYYYTSDEGSEETMQETRAQIAEVGFNARVFKRTRGKQHAKGVDIALATDMLSHAIHGHYDLAILMAGDGDYVPLVNEVKRHGRLVAVAFFETAKGLHQELRLAADAFVPLDSYLLATWNGGVIPAAPKIL